MIARRRPRFAVQLPVVFTGHHPGGGIVTKLSFAGCCVERSNTAVAWRHVLTMVLSLCRLKACRSAGCPLEYGSHIGC
jgi:hypothetical protein